MTLQIEVEGFSSVLSFFVVIGNVIMTSRHKEIRTLPQGHSSSYFLFLLHLSLLYEDRQEDRRHDNPLCGNNYCDC